MLLKILIYGKSVTIKSPRSLTYAVFQACWAIQNECLKIACTANCYSTIKQMLKMLASFLWIHCTALIVGLGNVAY